MNEEITTQESIPTTAQEAYDSLMESINEETEEETTFELSEEEQALLDQAVEEAYQEIPVNSDTLLVDTATSRFSSAIWYENIQKKVIILAGIGGIGRFGNLKNF